MHLSIKTPILLLSCLLFLSNLIPTSGLRFYLHDRERRCFKIDTPPLAKIIGHRAVDDGKGNAELSIEVKSSTGQLVYGSNTRDSKHNHFSFKSPAYNGQNGHMRHGHRDPDEYEDDDYYDDYEEDFDVMLDVCLMLTFDSHMHNAEGKRGVSFWMRPEGESAPELHNEEKAKSNTVQGMNRALNEMHDSLQTMAHELTNLRQREKRLVSRHESNARHVYILAALSVVVIIGTSTLQFLHFKKYFQSKKLI